MTEQERKQRNYDVVKPHLPKLAELMKGQDEKFILAMQEVLDYYMLNECGAFPKR